MAATYVPILIAFTSGIIFVCRNEKIRGTSKNLTNHTCENSTKSMSDSDQMPMVGYFFEFIYILMGAALDPEPIEQKLEWCPEFKWDRQHYVAAGLYYVYQIIIVIILINLLIAVMNASVSIFSFINSVGSNSLFEDLDFCRVFR